MTPEHVKVYFRLVQDESGYPPASVESVWARVGVRPDEFILDNIPFFTRDATIGDAVQTRVEDNQRWFERVVRRSGNSLIRVVYFRPDQRARVEEHLESLGCSMEFFSAYSLLAVNVPKTTALADVQAFLGTEHSAGFLDYEEPILRQ